MWGSREGHIFLLRCSCCSLSLSSPSEKDSISSKELLPQGREVLAGRIQETVKWQKESKKKMFEDRKRDSIVLFANWKQKKLLVRKDPLCRGTLYMAEIFLQALFIEFYPLKCRSCSSMSNKPKSWEQKHPLCLGSATLKPQCRKPHLRDESIVGPITGLWYSRIASILLQLSHVTMNFSRSQHGLKCAANAELHVAKSWKLFSVYHPVKSAS